MPLIPVPNPDPTLYSRRILNEFVTLEMVDKGLVLKSSIELTARMGEAFVAKLVSDVTAHRR